VRFEFAFPVAHSLFALNHSWGILVKGMTIRNIVLTLLFLFFMVAFTRNLFSYQQNLLFYKTFKDDYDATVSRNNKLKSELVKNTDTYQMEKRIRDKLNLARKNETAILLPEPTLQPISPTPTVVPTYLQWWLLVAPH
jgi:hypothetical protein